MQTYACLDLTPAPTQRAFRRFRMRCMETDSWPSRFRKPKTVQPRCGSSVGAMCELCVSCVGMMWK